MDFFSIRNILIHIPLGTGGYDLSYIEAIGTIAGLLCIWLASQEKIINYLFGLINVTLFAVIFFQIQLYASLILQIFFFAANVYGWYAWSRVDDQKQTELKIRWLNPKQMTIIAAISIFAILVMTFNIDRIFGYMAKIGVLALQGIGFNVTMTELQPDAFPFWDSVMTVLSIVAMILMTRKHVENWLIWIIINVISIVIYYQQGVLAMSLQYIILMGIALNGAHLWIKAAKHDEEPLKENMN
ncbi:nicotinamide riboside transporter PnuC [Xenorhabdus nematophila]|uniref:Nicotinamide riboside transporter PnuC n=1 Tax=Xenorhabdus nematophila (strain ATCC 19061 / DSM 3370 / CCUG 14189 / LMG 1036 / NCIMB 9965 / AN6) TaxID=406817 RepID=D3VAQ0_XENNA|nr:nicotinamide riboside transporter PnuC [Xenorhabdus nematophila]CEE91745.1 nucleoside/purine/pyrimidine transport protein (NMN family) [Xenorhabdus nematophila str. Anatoliense]CEF32276.1 nucleoside/purine/pyrimidine transport protein (NMN family) [Xenorhabdus nematophila str. Websteri]AYA39699.1 nicotinamide riboside transporter PnuC [Xenorhabdus nematophila]KHD27374.1 nicotinamide riboside transporter PnuC [Xenorhabdus nematophila]MBA0018270.1 nicotinamide riboside transporter PnuC [Xenor